MSAGQTIKLFFALCPDDRTRAALEQFSGALHSVAGGRRAPPGRLHLTIAFLGATPSERLAELQSIAARVRASACELLIDQSGYWKRNRIAWAGASSLPAELQRLSEELRRELDAAGFRFDAKPFVPHITLLRNAREPGQHPELSAIRWPVSSFALVHSHTDAKGLAYRVVSSWALQHNDAE